MASYPQVMVGKLMLNPRYLIFHAYEPRYTGVFQAGRLTSTGQVLSIALDTIVDVTVESGVRARRSRPNWRDKDDYLKKCSGERAINSHPRMLDDTENYSTLMLTLETETEGGVEIARFEVQNPRAWEQTLKSQLAKGTS